MSTVKDLGAVSAYALAVKYGYAGTEEQWVNEQEAKRKQAVDAANSASINANTVIQKVAEAKEATTMASEASKNAEEYAEAARVAADNAQAVTGVEIAKQGRAGLVKGGDNYIEEDGTLRLTKQTIDTTLSNSYAGGLKVIEVQGASEQDSTTGAQLFDGALINGYKETIDGTYAQTGGVYKTINFEVLTNGIYTFSFSEDVMIVRFDGTQLNTTTNIYTVSLEVGSHYISFRNTTNTTWNDSVEIMFNAGDTALPWEPYTGCQASPNPSYPQEIESVVVSEIKTSGKNLLDVSQSLNGMPDEDGWYTVSYDNTAGTSMFYIFRQVSVSDLLEVSTEYAIVAEVQEISNVKLSYVSGSTNGSMGQFVTSVFCTTTGTHVSINTTRDSFEDCASMLRTTIGIEAGAIGSVKFRLSVLKDTSITADTFVYEPYQESSAILSEPITLHGIGDVKDRIINKDGVWGIERRFAEIIFDGSEDETWVNSTSVSGRYGITSVKMKAKGNHMCTVGNGAINTSGNLFITTSFETLDDWLIYLTENPITVTYELAEPSFESLPTVDQIALNSLKTFDIVTHVTTDSEVQPTIEVVYGTSKVGGYSLDAWNTAKRNEISMSELISAVLMLNQE